MEAMSQMLLDIDVKQYGPWIVTHRGDKDCAALADRHYTRQTHGSPQFCRPGPALILRTAAGDALWTTWRGFRKDGLDAYECTIFRNESEYQSSDLIRWAVIATLCEWGDHLPKDGIITYVDEGKVINRNPGFCYLQAGFRKIGRSKSRNLLLLQLMPDRLAIIKHEYWLIEYLKTTVKQLQLALDSGEYMEAPWFFREARSVQEQIRTMRDIRKTMKRKLWTAYELELEEEDLLEIISPEEGHLEDFLY